MSDELALPSKNDLEALVIAHTCSRKCFGNAGASSGCCRLDDRDYIIGPIPDAEALLQRLRDEFDPSLTYDDVFIGAEEGAALFPDKSCWQVAKNFPALRTQSNDPRHRCRFLSDDGLCRIHAIRSVTCRNYQCSALKNLLAQL